MHGSLDLSVSCFSAWQWYISWFEKFWGAFTGHWLDVCEGEGCVSAHAVFDLHVCDLPSQILSVCRLLTWWCHAWLRLHHNEMEAFQCGEHQQIRVIAFLPGERVSWYWEMIVLCVCVCVYVDKKQNKQPEIFFSARVELFSSLLDDQWLRCLSS